MDKGETGIETGIYYMYIRHSLTIVALLYHFFVLLK